MFGAAFISMIAAPLWILIERNKDFKQDKQNRTMITHIFSGHLEDSEKFCINWIQLLFTSTFVVAD